MNNKKSKMTKRNELPDMCYTALRTTNEFVVIKKNENGYFPYKNFEGGYEEAKKLADLYNRQLGLSPAQVEAMVCGSMFGWDNAAAVPQSYLDSAFLTETIYAEGHLYHSHGPISGPVKGNLYRYNVAGKEVYYLDLNAIVAYNDYFLRYCIGCLLPDLVAGIPLIPVKATKDANGTYTFTIEKTAVEPKEVNAAYYICCRIDVGEIQFVLAYHPSQKAPTPYVNWERIPANERDTDLPNYNLGHYCSDAKAGVEDFVKRVVDKYNWQKSLRIR